MNVPVCNYNPNQRERFRKRLLLFYSIYDPEGSGRTTNALTLKIPEQMVMSSLYSKYNVNFEKEEQAARQKGLLPEQQHIFNNSLGGGGAAEAQSEGGPGSSDDLFGMGRNGSGNTNNMRNRAQTSATYSRQRSAAFNPNNLQQQQSMSNPSGQQSSRNHAASLVIPPTHLQQPQQQQGMMIQDSEFGPMQQSHSTFSAHPSTNNMFATNNNNGQNQVADASSESHSRRGQSNSVSSSPSSFHKTQHGFPHQPPNNQQHQQEVELPIFQLPESEKQRISKRVDRFYKKYFPEGAWKAQEAKSSPMTETDLFESLCSSLKVSKEAERALAAELLPGSQGEAASGVKSWYEEQLKKMEEQHQKQLEEEKKQKDALEAEKQKLAREREEHAKQMKEEKEQMEREMREERERMEQESKAKKMRASLPPSPFIKSTEAPNSQALSASQNSSVPPTPSNQLPPPMGGGTSASSSSQAVEAQLAFLKHELESAKKYTEALEKCHKAEMEEKESELLQRLQEKVALERKLTEDAQTSPSRRDLLYGSESRRSQSKGGLFVDEDEDAPPAGEPPALTDSCNAAAMDASPSAATTNDSSIYTPNKTAPTASMSYSEKRHRERMEKAYQEKYSSPERFLANYDATIMNNEASASNQDESSSPWAKILNKQYYAQQHRQLQQRSLSRSRSFQNNNNDEASGSPPRSIMTPASPVRIKGHASPEHPLLMVCGVCGEQGRDRFCHNCGANYSGVEYVPPS